MADRWGRVHGKSLLPQLLSLDTAQLWLDAMAPLSGLDAMPMSLVSTSPFAPPPPSTFRSTEASLYIACRKAVCDVASDLKVIWKPPPISEISEG